MVSLRGRGGAGRGWRVRALVVCLSFEHLDAVDAALAGAGAPAEAQSVGNGALVDAQVGDEGAQGGLAGGEGGGHPRLEQLAVVAHVHDGGEAADAGGNGGQLWRDGEGSGQASVVGVGRAGRARGAGRRRAGATAEEMPRA